VIAPTPELPKILSEANIAISASGTSAWELCTLGIPSLLLAVVGNQVDPLKRLVDRQLVLGLDLTSTKSREQSHVAGGDIASVVRHLIREEKMRQILTERCRDDFDGLGKDRVVLAMETLAAEEGF
jgi:spore coat polysaccharide biosynthesis predicted glycosyltransferase SpsG